jgi:hypothetical protein
MAAIGEWETLVTHALSASHNPKNHPLTRLRSFRDDRTCPKVPEIAAIGSMGTSGQDRLT